MAVLGLLHSLIRAEEKMILEAARDLDVPIVLKDIRKEIFDPETYQPDFDVALERSVSTVKGIYVSAFLESMNIPVVNPLSVAEVCEDKFLTSLYLWKAGVPTMRFSLVFGLEEAMEVIEEWGGFPVVLKPPHGSWGRLLAKVNDREALEAIIEHKEVLGSPPHKAFYLQEYVRKPGRDIRVFVIGDEVVCAVYRESSHWITNTARGGRTRNCPVYDQLRDICVHAAKAIGGGLLAIDVFETEKGLKINEINHTMEFRNSEEPTGIRISHLIVEYCLQKASQSHDKDRSIPFPEMSTD